MPSLLNCLCLRRHDFTAHNKGRSKCSTSRYSQHWDSGDWLDPRRSSHASDKWSGPSVCHPCPSQTTPGISDMLSWYQTHAHGGARDEPSTVVIRPGVAMHQGIFTGLGNKAMSGQCPAGAGEQSPARPMLEPGGFIHNPQEENPKGQVSRRPHVQEIFQRASRGQDIAVGGRGLDMSFTSSTSSWIPDSHRRRQQDHQAPGSRRDSQRDSQGDSQGDSRTDRERGRQRQQSGGPTGSQPDPDHQEARQTRSQPDRRRQVTHQEVAPPDRPKAQQSDNLRQYTPRSLQEDHVTAALFGDRVDDFVHDPRSWNRQMHQFAASPPSPSTPARPPSLTTTTIPRSLFPPRDNMARAQTGENVTLLSTDQDESGIPELSSSTPVTRCDRPSVSPGHDYVPHRQARGSSSSRSRRWSGGKGSDRDSVESDDVFIIADHRQGSSDGRWDLGCNVSEGGGYSCAAVGDVLY